MFGSAMLGKFPHGILSYDHGSERGEGWGSPSKTIDFEMYQNFASDAESTSLAVTTIEYGPLYGLSGDVS